MRARGAGLPIGLLVVALIQPLPAEDAPPDGVSLAIVVQDVRGDAEVCFDGRSAWGPVVKGMAIPVGSQLCTGAGGFVWLAFGTNSVAFVREGSLFRIDSFGMEGDELVARVHIDPGIASVSVVQREQFLTDFRVSTPRLTASIRGSGETVIANGDEVADRVFVDEHFAEVVHRNGAVLGVAEGGATNSNGQTPHELATIENLADVTPEGATPQETRSVETLAATSQSTDVVGSNLTFSSTSNPAAGLDTRATGTVLEPYALVFDPGQNRAPDQLQELGHFVLLLGNIETDLSRDREEFRWRWERMYMDMLPDGQAYQYQPGDATGVQREPYDRTDVPPEWDAPEEFSDAHAAMLHEIGTRAFIEEYLLVQIELDQHHRMEQMLSEWMDATEVEQRHADFHRDAYGEGFDRFAEDLRAAVDAAERGELQRELLGRALLDAAHMVWHMETWKDGREDRGYDEEHAIVHQEYIRPLLDKLEHGPFHEYVDAILEIEHMRWHNGTELPDELEPGSREAERHDHYHGHLDEMRETLLPGEPAAGPSSDPQDLPPTGGEGGPPQS